MPFKLWVPLMIRPCFVKWLHCQIVVFVVLQLIVERDAAPAPNLLGFLGVLLNSFEVRSDLIHFSDFWLFNCWVHRFWSVAIYLCGRFVRDSVSKVPPFPWQHVQWVLAPVLSYFALPAHEHSQSFWSALPTLSTPRHFILALVRFSEMGLSCWSQVGWFLQCGPHILLSFSCVLLSIPSVVHSRHDFPRAQPAAYQYLTAI